MAKAKQRASSAGSSAKGGKRSSAAARERPSVSEHRTATRPPPKKSAHQHGKKALPAKALAVKTAAAKADKVAKKSTTASKVAKVAKPAAHKASAVKAAKIDVKLHAKSNREIEPVKDGGSDGRVAAAAKLAVAKAKDGKGKDAKSQAKGRDGKAKVAADSKAAQDGKVGKDGKVRDAKGKLVKGKGPVVPPPPPRKIQVVQLSSLKPGARGTRAVLARRPDEVDDKSQTNGAKKRRSAELTGTQIGHFRELLEQRRHRLSNDLTLMQDEALKVTGQDNSADSVADAGTDNYEQDFTLGLIESEEALAREVDEALMRIDRNAFGVCESCETPIPLARLEILPFTRCCVECQQKREGRP
jgi:RNA polymerase-binding protein DksA